MLPVSRPIRAVLPAALLLALAFSPAARAAADDDEADRVALASMLYADGHAERAAAVLREVDPTAPGVNLPRYHLLRGLLALKAQDHAGAAAALEAALAAGEPGGLVHVFLAQARAGLQDWKGVLAALDAARGAGDHLVGTALLRAEALSRLHDPAAALAVLGEARVHFPDDLEISRRRTALLVELGLFQSALEEGRVFLERPEASADDHLAVADALRRGGARPRAMELLETARLRFPADTRLSVQLAGLYAEAGQPLSAAGLLRQAALTNPAYAVEAAELYRRAGHFVQALHLNAQVADQPAKIRQRLGLLLDMGRFDEAAALVPRLLRLGLLEDENVLYAVGYARFQTGDYVGAEAMLTGLRDPALFAQSVELRRAMERCRQEASRCW